MKLFALVWGAALSCLAQQTASPFASRIERYRRDETAGMTTDERIAFYQKKLAADPENVQLMGRLASAFLQKMRETTDFAYLDRASSLVDRMMSLDKDEYEALRLRIEIAMQWHRFPKVVEYARDLLDRNPSDSGVVGLLGDAQMELGRYEEAGKAYQRMMDLAPGLFSYNRYAYHQWVTGHKEEALAWMAQAVQAGSLVAENTAWCRVELGDLLFKTGRLKEAEVLYREALTEFAGYHRANAALGRVLAAREEWKEAIARFKAAQNAVPLPEYAASLENLFRRTGDNAEAGRQRNLVDVVEKLMRANGEKANRTLALIYADEERNLPRALEIARAEFDVRDDVYSYDVYSWVLLKNGKVAEARKASEKALALNTPEPIFQYHAGLIALAAGSREEARAHLGAALAMNPTFDFVQGPEARRILASLR
jgi:tetratricopeptide (TPR) repeat protein